MVLPITTYQKYRESGTDNSFNQYRDELEQVRAIIKEVQNKGDRALLDYTEKYDRAVLENLTVDQAEMELALKNIEPELLEVIRSAMHNIRRYHEHQIRSGWWSTEEGSIVGQRIMPLQSVGAYIPGGTAAYPSSVLMTVIPAIVAGVKDIYVCTPPDSTGRVNPVTLAASSLAGAKAVYKIGGAQAVAALAYGTETVRAVQKIVGPGNIYVTLAKKEVYGHVGIDMLAGPSEIVIVADDQANPAYIAADLLSQAEHDPLSRSILVTCSESLAVRVDQHLEEQLKDLPRRKIALQSLSEKGAAILVSSLDQAWNVVNDLAPEHLELHLEEAWSYLENIKCAGAIFIGPYAPEPLGDYWAGSNHVLPTGSAARYASPLSVDDFYKKTSVIYYSREAMVKAAGPIADLARSEGLEAHARAALIRRKRDESSGRD